VIEIDFTGKSFSVELAELHARAAELDERCVFVDCGPPEPRRRPSGRR
jgi:hypothetical protein